MVSTSKITQRLIKLISTRSATSFYLNGPPGSGKSHLLMELASQVPREIPRAVSFGPYKLKWAEVNTLANQVLRDCLETGFLDELPEHASELDLVSAWQWIYKKAEVSNSQTLLVFIDLTETSQPNLPIMSNLFSSIRYLEGIWEHDRLRIHHMLAGYWNPSTLKQYYRSIDTSFPYTSHHNCVTWDGLCGDEMTTLVKQCYPNKTVTIEGQLLFELTGGHPAAALEILNQGELEGLSLTTLLQATQVAAKNGLAGKALLEVWSQLPSETRLLLKKLLLTRHVAAIWPQSLIDELLTAGVIRQDRIGTKGYLSFRSWYAELLIRLHPEHLGIDNEQTSKIRLDELMPEVSILNIEAYRLINSIENAARNFIAIQLCLNRVNGAHHILEGRNRKYDKTTDTYNDAYQRAQEWKTRSSRDGHAVEMNPLLAYCSTPDLAGLIREVGIEIKSKPWQQIAQAIEDLSSIRNAVMHNQIIDEIALQKLYDLQLDIYETLSQAK